MIGAPFFVSRLFRTQTTTAKKRNPPVGSQPLKSQMYRSDQHHTAALPGITGDFGGAIDNSLIDPKQSTGPQNEH